ncbi:Sodium/calcium exchanger protein-domain-containing protein [Fusarium flagelliforme]|uniref:Sodium/calcium exchanger protein-domain-containing protein n=1 Tax=Fusarium flagelliforme TaxID=2675880 RepID=UPI001E8DF97D|nr:Sodium/calcium exchanger protein-domain-containing protein [Fusarium flagelliforme]KAH7198884.1 Sodium/calcium exchanger protein-domain-containing protein [Fusarium flagelliforme]
MNLPSAISDDSLPNSPDDDADQPHYFSVNNPSLVESSRHSKVWRIVWHVRDTFRNTYQYVNDRGREIPPQEPTVRVPLLPACLEPCDTNGCSVLSFGTKPCINGLLVFVAAGIVSYLLEASPLLVFICNAIAIVPLSALLTDATEEIAARAGDTIGALLNITFGNLVELILFSIALKENKIYVVQASILGSILVNLLLVLGTALVASSVAGVDMMYNTAEAQLLACLLFVSIFVVLIPTAFAQSISDQGRSKAAGINMARISAFIVLLIYVLYFVHQLRCRPDNADDVESQDDVGSNRHLSQSLERRSRSFGPQVLPPRTIRFADDSVADPRADSIYKLNDMSESGIIEPTESDEVVVDRGRRSGEMSRTDLRRASSYQAILGSRRHSRSFSISSSRAFRSRESSMSGDRRHTSSLHLLRDARVEMDDFVYKDNELGMKTSVALLIITSALMSLCGEFLVSTIDDVTHDGSLSEPLIGLVILPIVGNVAEYVTVVAVAIRGNLDLAIAVAVGSSIQIALCIAPLTVLAGWAMQKDLDLAFDNFEMVTLVGAVLLVNLLILTTGSSDSRTGGLKGALMCACYVIFR